MSGIIDESDAIASAIVDLLRELAQEEPEVVAAREQKTAERIAGLERENEKLRLQSRMARDAAADTTDAADRSAQLMQAREAFSTEALAGPFEAPSYELQIVGEHRLVRLIPVVDGKLGKAIESGLIPAPLTYEMTVTHTDINNLPIRARLAPVKLH